MGGEKRKVCQKRSEQTFRMYGSRQAIGVFSHWPLFKSVFASDRLRVVRGSTICVLQSSRVVTVKEKSEERQKKKKQFKRTMQKCRKKRRTKHSRASLLKMKDKQRSFCFIAFINQCKHNNERTQGEWRTNNVCSAF